MAYNVGNYILSNKTLRKLVFTPWEFAVVHVNI